VRVRKGEGRQEGRGERDEPVELKHKALDLFSNARGKWRGALCHSHGKVLIATSLEVPTGKTIGGGGL
jgi:hypothetical protein